MCFKTISILKLMIHLLFYKCIRFTSTYIVNIIVIFSFIKWISTIFGYPPTVASILIPRLAICS